MKRLLLLTIAALILAIPTATAATAPTTTALHQYMSGKRVRGLQWMLQGHSPSVYRIVAFRYPVNGYYGSRTVRAVHNMKYRLGYPKTALGGKIAGETFIAYLQGKRRPFAYRYRAGVRYNIIHAYELAHPPLSTKMKLLVSDANYLIAHNYQVGYSQANRMNIVRYKIHLPPLNRYIYEDCSSSVTGLYWLAGLPDPNRLGYNGYGYTGTQANHGTVVWHLGQSLGLLRVGDIIFYGGGFPHHHEAVYIGNGRVFSHGSNAGPVNVPVLYRSDAVGAHRYVPAG